MVYKTPPAHNCSTEMMRRYAGYEASKLAKNILKSNYNRFQNLKNVLDSSSIKKDINTTLGLVQFIANFAWTNHAGFFSSEYLENSLDQLADSLDLSNHKRSIPVYNFNCHIMTRAKSVGGHTKLVARWINEQEHEQHFLILTRQMGEKIPDYLIKAVKKSGGSVIDLQRQFYTTKSRLESLVKLMESSIQIVLHLHPYDAFTVLALKMSKSLPQVIFLNHADHVFWLGRDCANQFVHFRKSGMELSVNKRGISEHKNRILPIPITSKVRTTEQITRARNALGFKQNEVIGLTIASGYKLKKIGNVDFASLHAEIAQSQPSYKHIVIGLEEDDRWRAAKDLSNGRLIVIPPTPNIENYLFASDIYIDSYPLTSITSHLEASSYGMPVISYDPWGGHGQGILAPGEIFKINECKFFTKEDYRLNLIEMIRNCSLRCDIGNSLASAVKENHGSEKWSSTLSMITSNRKKIDEKENKLIHNKEHDNLLHQVLVLLSEKPSGSTDHIDIVASSVPYLSRIKLSQLEDFGYAGWLPEILQRNIISFMSKF